MRSRSRATPFFYQYGNAASIQSIDHVGKMLGMGEESGLQLSGEQTGNMPGPEWMQIHHPQERWSQAQTANVQSVRGYTLVSPCNWQWPTWQSQMAASAIPRLIDKVFEARRLSGIG